MSVLLAVALVVSLVLLVLAGIRIEQLQWEAKDAMQQGHAKCQAMVAAFVGNEFAARVLLSAADDYESMDGMATINRLANTVYTPDGPNIPALYLRDRAEAIRGDGPPQDQ